MTVWGGGALEGDSTLRTGMLAVQGVIRPGRSIGTLTIDGDVTFDIGSMLEVEVDDSGNSDKLAVVGDVNIVGGTVRPIAMETITGSHQYTIVEANSVAGTFDALDTALLDTYVLLGSEGLDYEPNAVLLTITPTPLNDPNIVQTPNQRFLGAALQQIVEGGGNSVTLALQSLETDDEVRAAYNQLSGRTRAPLGAVTVAAGARPTSIVSSRMRGVSGGQSSNSGMRSLATERGAGGLSDTTHFEVGTSRYTFALGNGTPYLSDQPWGVWGKWYGLYGDRETDGAELGYQYSAYGGGFGLDYQFSEPWLLGVTGGYWDGHVDFASSADRTELAGTYVGLYGSYENTDWYVDSIVTYASLDYETTRHVDLVSERLEGDFGGDMFSGYFEAGFNWWHRADCLIQPLASVQVSCLDIEGFTESGGSSNLSYDGEQYVSCRGGLGLKAIKQLFRHADGGRAEVELRGRWIHEFGDTQSSVDVRFASDPGAAFRINDAAIDRDSALLGAGLNAWLGTATRVFLDYDTELNSDRTVQMVSGGLEHRW